MHPSARMAVGWERNQSAVPEKEAVAADACPRKERGQAAKAEEKRRRFSFLRRCGAAAFLAVPAGISALRGVAVCRMAAVPSDFLSRRSSPGRLSRHSAQGGFAFRLRPPCALLLSGCPGRVSPFIRGLRRSTDILALGLLFFQALHAAIPARQGWIARIGKRNPAAVEIHGRADSPAVGQKDLCRFPYREDLSAARKHAFPPYRIAAIGILCDLKAQEKTVAREGIPLPRPIGGQIFLPCAGEKDLTDPHTGLLGQLFVKGRNGGIARCRVPGSAIRCPCPCGFSGRSGRHKAPCCRSCSGVYGLDGVAMLRRCFVVVRCRTVPGVRFACLRRSRTGEARVPFEKGYLAFQKHPAPSPFVSDL